jgi:hypothetical protein
VGPWVPAIPLKVGPAEPGGDTVDEAWIRAVGTAGGRALTFTCVPPGEGERMALGHDGDDGDE